MIVIVIWAIAIAAAVTVGLQLLCYRQATLGQEALGTRAGTLGGASAESRRRSRSWRTTRSVPDPNDAFRIVRDMEDVSYGDLDTGSWDIRHFSDGQEWAGPMDEHSKVNVNLASSRPVMNLPRMTVDVADAIVDWRDDNDDVEGSGAEKQYYANISSSLPAAQRRLPLASPSWSSWRACGRTYMRGEDWNLNGRLDPNEDDGNSELSARQARRRARRGMVAVPDRLLAGRRRLGNGRAPPVPEGRRDARTSRLASASRRSRRTP